MTYSIVARDSTTGELGIAVQSRWVGVGAVVPAVRPGVGAIASQALCDPRYGHEGIELLAEGLAPEVALERLLGADRDPQVRQVGIVDAQGRTAAWTGNRCIPAAGHSMSVGVSVQANLMERPSVWPAMLRAFERAGGDLAARLLSALQAAEAEGGDVRGRQSAALIVVPGEKDVPRWVTRFDVRVDDHPAPLVELERLLSVARGYETYARAVDLIEAGAVAEAVAEIDRAADFAPQDDQIRLWQAFIHFSFGDESRGRALYGSALEAEPRSGEHLRRFAQTFLPGREADVERLVGAARSDSS